jgi:predicted metal-dependent enzyme (double-stranded beta helix superfamily)
MFDLDRFRADCCASVNEGQQLPALREVVARAVEDPRAVLKVLGESVRAEVQTLHRAADLTILNVIWGPRMTVMPHNHNMWAVIGIYTGREDNILWRRVPDEPRRPNRGRERQGNQRTRRPALGPRHHPFRDQPDRTPDRRDSRVRWRLLRGATQ